MKTGLIICTVLALVGCSRPPVKEVKKEHVIPAADVIREKSKYALLKDVAESIESAARRGRTEDSLFMGWYSTDEVVDIIIVLRKRGYRVTIRNDEEEGITKGQWLDISWGSSDGQTAEPVKE